MQTQITFGKPGLAPSTQQSRFYGAPVASTSAPRRRAAAGAVDIDAVTEADLRLAIGANWAKYEKLWPGVRDELRQGEWSPQKSGSWPGFFFGTVWLLYRKQYGAACVDILTRLAIGYVVPSVSVWLNLGVCIAISLFGKWWILRNVALTAARIRSLGLSESETRARIQKHGGATWKRPALVGTVLALIAVAVAVPAMVKGFEEGYERSKAAHAHRAATP